MNNQIPHSCDVLVIGTGIAGLYFALKLSELDPSVNIAVLCKGNKNECNTVHAQGGIAAVMHQGADRFEKHFADTMLAGSGTGDPEITKRFVKDIPECIQDLIDYGVSFDRNDGEFNLHLEGGHSEPRVLHVKDHTGLSVHEVLQNELEKHPNIKIYEHIVVTRLLTDPDESLKNNKYKGVQVYSEDRDCLTEIRSNAIMLATGGSGALFRYTTNPDSASGDGVALALKAGLPIRDMKYYQFHPTALYDISSNTSLFLLTEALRGEGAFLCNTEGKRFVFRYDARGELACRDVVSHAIRDELSCTGKECVFLDLRHLDPKEIECKFPSVCKVLKDSGYQIDRDLIPVVPAAHYQCGGIVCNENGYAGLNGVYVSGEVASTGIHGKNRLASNSLAEALVFSKRAAADIHMRKIYSDAVQGMNIDVIQCGKPNAELEAESIRLLELLKTDLSRLFDLHYEEAFIEELNTHMNKACEICKACEKDLIYSSELIRLSNATVIVQQILFEFQCGVSEAGALEVNRKLKN